MCICVSTCVCHMCVGTVEGGGGSEPLELELQEVVSGLMWMLRTELQFNKCSSLQNHPSSLLAGFCLFVTLYLSCLSGIHCVSDSLLQYWRRW